MPRQASHPWSKASSHQCDVTHRDEMYTTEMYTWQRSGCPEASRSTHITHIRPDLRACNRHWRARRTRSACASCRAGSTSLTSSPVGELLPYGSLMSGFSQQPCSRTCSLLQLHGRDAVEVAQLSWCAGLQCPLFVYRLEALLFGGWKGEVWVQPGKEPTLVCFLCLSIFFTRSPDQSRRTSSCNRQSFLRFATSLQADAGQT
jgi:hypothetical protein